MSLSLVSILFGGWLQRMNGGVIEPYGDGFKAYHAILYHARYDSTAHWYQGMNYPYGEHVVPGASQPLLSNAVRLVESLTGQDVSQYGWGIVHGSMLLGMVLAVLAIFVLLRRLGVSYFVSLAAALLLTLLAPQVPRLGAHYGLAHLEVLPLCLLGLHYWHERPGWRRCWPVALTVLIFSLIHFYYFAILAFTVGGFLGARWLLSKEWGKWWHYGLQLLFMFGVPAFLLFGWIEWTDPTVGRNANPYGFSVYQAHPLSVFTSADQPHWRSLIAYDPEPGFEGRAYVGLASLVLLGLLLGRWIGRLGRTSFVPAARRGRSFLNALLLAGAGLLAFSFGFPIDELGGEQLVEYLGPLRQFRSVGRFAWLFYYALGLSLWCLIDARLTYRYFFPHLTATVRARWRVGLLVVVAGLMAFEGYHYWRANDHELDPLPDLFEQPLATDLGLDYDRFQAIVPIPYYNIGSGNYWFDQSGRVAQKAQILSWQTGLPLTSAMLTRTALWQTLRQLQFVGEPYRPAALLNDLPDRRPFLLVVDQKYWRDFGLRQNHLTAAANLLARRGELEYYELPLDGYARVRDSLRLAAYSDYGLDTSLVKRKGNWRSTPDAKFFYTDFDTITHSDFRLTNEVAKPTLTEGYRSRGSSGRLDEGQTFLDLTGSIDSSRYVLSFWMDLKPQRHARARLDVGIDQQGPWTMSFPLAEHLRLLDPNGWGLLEFPLHFELPVKRLTLALEMPLLHGQSYRVDDVLLRPTGAEVYDLRGGELFYNNRYYPPGE